MKSIFNTCVKVTSQEQANRLKQICVDNGLPLWNDFDAFTFFDEYVYFSFDDINIEFWIRDKFGKKEVTESEWLELLEQHNKTK